MKGFKKPAVWLHLISTNFVNITSCSASMTLRQGMILVSKISRFLLSACQSFSSSPARSLAGRHPQHPETKEAFSETGPGHGLCPDQVKPVPPPGASPRLASEHKVTQRLVLFVASADFSSRPSHPVTPARCSRAPSPSLSERRWRRQPIGWRSVG